MEQERLPHATTEELLDYMEDRLSQAEQRRLEAHLAADCLSCRQELDGLRGLLSLMRSDDWLAPPAHLRLAAQRMYAREYAGALPEPAVSVGDWLRALLAPRPRLALALSVLLIALVSLFLLIQTGGETLPETPAGLVAGSLEIRSAGSDAWRTLDSGGLIAQGDAVRTGAEASTVLVFPDQSMAQLQASTELAVKELSRDASGAQRLVLVQSSGQTRHRVEPFASPGGRYVIETPSASVSVRGTQFIVEVGPEGQTNVRVGEGTVEVTAQGRMVTLAAGQSVTVAQGEAPGVVVAIAPASVPTVAPLATLAPRPTPTASVVEAGQAPELLPTPTLRATPTSTLTIQVQPPQVDQDATQAEEDGKDSNRPEIPPGQASRDPDKDEPPGQTRRPPNDDDGSGSSGGGNSGGKDKNN